MTLPPQPLSSGRCRATGSSRLSFPSWASISTATAVICFEAEAMWKAVEVSFGLRVFTSAKP